MTLLLAGMSDFITRALFTITAHARILISTGLPSTVFTESTLTAYPDITRPVLEIVRRKDRLRFPESPESRESAYFFESLGFTVASGVPNSYFAEFQKLLRERSKRTTRQEGLRRADDVRSSRRRRIALNHRAGHDGKAGLTNSRAPL
jgi:hypothetical protein